MGCLRSLTGATAGAERSAPTTTSLSPASSCKASHSPSAKVRTPPRSLSSSGGATQPRAAVLPCWRDGCGASCDANCDASCDASESGAVAKRSAQAERMAKGAQRGNGGSGRRVDVENFLSPLFSRDLRAQPGEFVRQPSALSLGRRMLRATLLLSALCCAAGFMAPASPLRIAAVSQSSQLDISSEPLPALRCHAEPACAASQTVGRRLAAWSEQSSS